MNRDKIGKLVGNITITAKILDLEENVRACLYADGYVEKQDPPKSPGR